ncbi:hypothetical protein [Methanofollis ethanolicus]|uniref:hypothetical protein n=1 Tax=Methanofollis ethanolicus TaxID=488124 RepID=UPI00082B9CC5|nr:hypothetical protein [Methanofollis ethanolicus]
MSEKTVHFVAADHDLTTLDEQIPYMGFTSRSEYLRACITVTVHGAACADAAGKLDPVTRDWIEQMREHGDRRHDDEKVLLEYIGKVGLPLIAMKGLRTAFKVLKNDLNAEVLRQTGRTFSEDEIWQILRTYAAYHKVEIEEHRSKVALAHYAGVKAE